MWLHSDGFARLHERGRQLRAGPDFLRLSDDAVLRWGRFFDDPFGRGDDINQSLSAVQKRGNCPG